MSNRIPDDSLPNNNLDLAIRKVIAAGVIGEVRSIEFHVGTETMKSTEPCHESVLMSLGPMAVHRISMWIDALPQIVDCWHDSMGGVAAAATICLSHERLEIDVRLSRLAPLSGSFRIEGTLGCVEGSVSEGSECWTTFNHGGRQRVCADQNPADAKPHAEAEAVRELLAVCCEKAKSYPADWNRSLKPKLRVVSDCPTQAPRVLIAGASDAAGARLCEVMHLRGGFTPVAAVADGNANHRLSRLPIQVEHCDGSNSFACDQLSSDVDAVVFFAAACSPETREACLRNLLESSERHGVERFIMISTSDVYSTKSMGSIDEDAPLGSDGKADVASYIHAERLCKTFMDRGLSITILRPDSWYGMFNEPRSIDLASVLETGNTEVLEPIADITANLVYVDDFMDAILLALTHDRAGNETFNVAGADPVTWRRFCDAFAEALDLPVRLGTPAKRSTKGLVKQCLRSIVRLTERVCRKRLAPEQRYETPTARKATLDDRKIRERLGYAPVVDIGNGTLMTAAWVRQNRLLDAPVEAVESIDARSQENAFMEFVLS